MIRWTIVLATAGVAGAGAGLWIAGRDASAPAVGAAVRQDARLGSSAASPGAEEADRRLSRRPAPERSLPSETIDGIEQTDQRSSTLGRGEALHAIAARADEKRLRELILQAEAIENESDRVAALEILLLRLAELDPEIALQRALESDPRSVGQLVTALSVRTPAQAWTFVSKVADPLARMEYQAAVSTAWIAQDPQKAFTSVAELPSSWSREQLLRYVTRNIAFRDPQRAIELVATIEHDPDASALLEAIAEQWGRSDPSAAAQWVETAETGMRQGRLAYQIADAYVMQKPQEALAWALRISRSPARYLWSHMIGQIAIDNPQEALRLAQGAENPSQRTQALGEALTTIAARDPALAMSQLQKLPAGEARTQVASRRGVANRPDPPGGCYRVAGTAGRWPHAVRSRETNRRPACGRRRRRRRGTHRSRTKGSALFLDSERRPRLRELRPRQGRAVGRQVSRRAWRRRLSVCAECGGAQPGCRAERRRASRGRQTTRTDAYGDVAGDRAAFARDGRPLARQAV